MFMSVGVPVNSQRGPAPASSTPTACATGGVHGSTRTPDGSAIYFALIFVPLGHGNRLSSGSMIRDHQRYPRYEQTYTVRGAPSCLSVARSNAHLASVLVFPTRRPPAITITFARTAHTSSRVLGILSSRSTGMFALLVNVDRRAEASHLVALFALPLLPPRHRPVQRVIGDAGLPPPATTDLLHPAGDHPALDVEIQNEVLC